MSEPKVFGKFCGLGCDFLGGLLGENMEHSCCVEVANIEQYYCLRHEGLPNLEFDQTTNQIERCSQCLSEFPGED